MNIKRILTATALVATAGLVLSGCASSSSSEEAADAASNELNLIEPGVLTVGTDTATKPFAYVEGDTITGFDVELIRAVGEKMGLEVSIVAQEFSTLLPAVVNGQIDTVADSVSMTDERKKTVDFSDPYYIDHVVVLNLEGSGITEEIESLSGKKIGVLQGTAQDAIATETFEGAEIVRFPDNVAAFQALKNGTIEGQFTDGVTASGFVDDNADLALQLGYGITTEDTPAGFPVKPGNPALVKALNEALAEVIQDGTYLELYEQFFPKFEALEQFRPAA